MWKRAQKPTSTLRNVLLYGFLALLSVALYFRWFNFDIFTYGDWSYKHLDTLKDMLLPSAWIGNTGFGSFDELAWRAPFNFLFGLGAALHIPINVSEKFLVFMPIALTSFIAPYVLLHEITKNRLASIVGAIFYATNTYFLAINPQGHQLLTLAANILTLAFAVFIKALAQKGRGMYVAAALLLWAAGIVDVRLLYIGAMLFSLYFLYWRFMTPGPKVVPVAALLLFGGITALLQFGWLAATYMSGGPSSGDAVLSRSLFGSEFWDLPSALTLHHPFWTGVTTSWFIPSNIPLSFWLIPLAVCAALIIERKNTYVIFFAVVAVLGILLSKQTSEPFSGLYPFLFEHLPGFGAFRESTKFYYLVALGYSVILAGLLVSLQRLRANIRFGRTLLAGTATVLVGLAAINALPYLTGSMHKLLSPRTMPADYAAIAKKLERDSTDYYRTLWVPIAPRWSYYNSTHPRVNGTNLVSIARDQAARVGGYTSPAEQLHALITSPLFAQYLATGSIKYVYVPLRDTANQDDFFPFYGDDRQFYIDALDGIDFLQRTDAGTKDVVVYENKNYRPYITTTDKLYALPERTDLESLGIFMANRQNKNFNFTTDLRTPASSVTDVFGTLSTDSIAAGKLKTDVVVPQDGMLYLNTAQQELSYRINGVSLQLEAARSLPLSIDGKPLAVPGGSETLGTIQLDDSRSYYGQLDGTIVPINPRLASRYLGVIHQHANILSAAHTNLVANGSFEDGPWQPKVGDCNAYDRAPGIGMVVDGSTATDGQKSLELAASRHTACVASNEILVEGGQQYLVTFNYKAPYAKRISFGANFDGKATTKHIFTDSGTEDWRTAYEVVTAPAGAKRLSLQLFGLPPANYTFGTTVTATRYDNVGVYPLTTDLSTTTAVDPLPLEQLTAGTHVITYTDAAITGHNLVKNGSLESGAWQTQAKTCDDQTGISDIAVRASSVASDGKKSLELAARGRVACTGPDSIPVAENSSYLLSFDHQSTNNKSASFSASFNDPGKSGVGDNFKTTAQWQNYRRVITTPPGTTELRLKVYTSSSATEGITHTNRYDNFQLQSVPPVQGRLYAVNENTALRAPKQTLFTSISQTKKIVTIRGASRPFYLTLGETYSSGWKVALGSANVGPENHSKLDDYFNAWYIDPTALCASAGKQCIKQDDGSFDLLLTIDFAPQRWLTIGLLLIAITLLSVAGYGAFLWQQHKERNLS